MSEESAREITRLMQNAALDPRQWETALDATSAFVGGAGVALLCVETRTRFSPCSRDLDELMEDYFGRGWYRADLREACVPRLKRTGFVFDHEVHSPAQIENSDFYQDFLRRHGRKWFAGVGTTLDGADWCLAFQRSAEQGPFTIDDMTRLTHVHESLKSTAHLASRIGQSWMLGLEHALAGMKQPALLLDHRARVLHMNEGAAALIGALVDSDRTLRLSDAATTAAFEAIFRRALAPLKRRPTGIISDVLVIGGRRHTCHASSLLDQERLIGTSAAVLVVLEPVAEDQSSVMRGVYGLTDAEARVSLALADGKTVKDVASEHRVKENTVRTQLKSVYSKLGVNRQSQLVAFIRDLDTVTG